MRNLFIALIALMGLQFSPLGEYTPLAITEAQASGCQSGSYNNCEVFVCANGIVLRGHSARTPSSRADACSRVLGGKGATKVSDRCIVMDVGRIPNHLKHPGYIIFAVHNPATFRQDCGVRLCTDCSPVHPKWGVPELAAELPIVNGKVRFPESWIESSKANAWACIPNSGLSVGLAQRWLIELRRLGRTPVGDPLEWGETHWARN